MTTLKSTFISGQDTFLGPQPSMWYGDSVPDGDAYPWKDAAIGSTYVYQTSTMSICYTKVAGNDVDFDWLPAPWQGTTALDGTASPWLTAPVGSVYTYVDENTTYGMAIRYTKIADGGDSDDWYGTGVLYELLIGFGDFTDGGGAAGTLDLTTDIPKGAFVTHIDVKNVTGFAGSSTCTLTVGDGSDVDRYNTGTPSIFATAALVDMGEPSGVQSHAAATTVTLTATEDSDWGDVAAGALDIYIHFHIQGWEAA